MAGASDLSERSIAAGALSALKSEFIAEALDELGALERGLAVAAPDSAETSEVFVRAHCLARWLKGDAGSHGLSLLAAAAQRLDDYLDAVGRPSAEHLRELQTFVDCLSALLERRGRGADSACHLVRRLPVRLA